MQLILLYGPPAVGKYTIGIELAARTGFRLFHNHLTVNLVSAVFERDSEAGCDCCGAFAATSLQRPQGISLIMTSVFRGTSENAEAWRAMLEPVHAEVGSVLFVQLTCERNELLRRVNCESRRALDKLIDPDRLTDLLDRFDMFSPGPFGPHLRLDVTHANPSESAARITRTTASASGERYTSVARSARRRCARDRPTRVGQRDYRPTGDRAPFESPP